MQRADLPPGHVPPVLYYFVKNEDTVDAPPYAILEVTGVDGDGNFTVTRPSADDITTFLVNGPTGIPAGARGQATAHFPAIVGYDFDPTDEGEPQAGETWGAQSGEWTIGAGQTGITVLGGASDGLVTVTRPLLPSAAAPSGYSRVYRDAAGLGDKVIGAGVTALVTFDTFATRATAGWFALDANNNGMEGNALANGLESVMFGFRLSVVTAGTGFADFILRATTKGTNPPVAGNVVCAASQYFIPYAGGAQGGWHVSAANALDRATFGDQLFWLQVNNQTTGNLTIKGTDGLDSSNVWAMVG